MLSAIEFTKGGGSCIATVCPVLSSRIGRPHRLTHSGGKRVNMFDLEAKHYEIFSKNFTSYAHEVINRTTADTVENLSEILDFYSTLMDECQSPIEQMLAAQLLFTTDGYNRFWYVFAHDAHTPEQLERYRPEWGTIFYPQGQIAGYHVDFLITVCCYGEVSLIAIECDGHDFHEKTKEQASRDKKRDRAIIAAGASVLRFTGSDIFKNVAGCAEEIENLAFNRLETMLIRQGHVAPREKKRL